MERVFLWLPCGFCPSWHLDRPGETRQHVIARGNRADPLNTQFFPGDPARSCLPLTGLFCRGVFCERFDVGGRAQAKPSELCHPVALAGARAY